jgi:hypothetical protein
VPLIEDAEARLGRDARLRFHDDWHCRDLERARLGIAGHLEETALAGQAPALDIELRDPPAGTAPLLYFTHRDKNPVSCVQRFL